MKHAGKAQSAGLRLILWTLVGVALLLIIGFLAHIIGAFVMGLSVVLLPLWVLFAVFTLNFFRDPDARVPAGKKLVLAPAHGTVDSMDEISEENSWPVVAGEYPFSCPCSTSTCRKRR